jgi:ATP-dependent Clp protease ATP-binding subunit ClpC
MNIFSKFSDESKLLLSLSYQEAQKLNSSYVGSEHFILAVLLNKNLLSDEILTKLDLDYDKMNEQIRLVAPKYVDFAGVKGYTNRTLNAFNRAFDLVKKSDKLVEVDDIILSILQDKDSYAFICASTINPKIGEIVEKEIKDRNPKEEKIEKEKEQFYKQFGTDMTQLVLENRFEHILVRDNEIKRILNILARRYKNNPCIVGDSGVGKTALVEGLAKYLVENETALKNKKIFRIDMASVVSGTKYRGEFEKRLKDILDSLRNVNDTILFIDDLAISIKAGAAEGSIDTSTILKNYMEKGGIQVITTTSFEDYKKIAEKDKGFHRRLEYIFVNEPSFEENVNILQTIVSDLKDHYKLEIEKGVIELCISLSKRYLAEKSLPDISIDLIDQTFASKIINKDTSPVNELDLRTTLSSMSGIPIENLSYADFSNLSDLEIRIKSKIIGQEEAINKIVKAIKRGRLGIKDNNKPIGSFLFLGNTGIGKTELSKVLATELYNRESFIVFDMTEFMEKHAVSKLIGSPPGYVGYEEGGLLTDKVRRYPYSLILFDEVEKAHPDIYNILLQILDEGHLTDSKGNKVDFKNTIIVMTSNIGTSELKKNRVGFLNGTTFADYSQTESILTDSLKKHFRPEFLNRLDEVVIFNNLTSEDIKEITRIKLNDFVQKVKRLNVQFTFTDECIDFISREGTNPEYGARYLNRTITKLVEDPFSDIMINGSYESSKKILGSIKEQKVVLSMIEDEE